MRALVPLLFIVGAAVLAIRLYVAAKQDVSDSTRARRIFWKLVDIFLYILGGVAAVALVIFLVGVVVQMWQNVDRKSVV